MNTLAAIFIATSAQFHLPPGLLSSLCFVESNHKTEAVHINDGKTNSYGVCQIKLETAKWLGFKGTATELMKPKVNIYYAGKYLARNLKRYHGNVNKAVTAYNKGHADSDKIVLSKYTTKVFKQWKVANNE